MDDLLKVDMDEDMRQYLETNTYLKQDVRWFKNKLVFAMTRKPLYILQIRAGRRRDSQCPLMEAVAHNLHTSESAGYDGANYSCSYLGPNDDALASVATVCSC